MPDRGGCDTRVEQHIKRLEKALALWLKFDLGLPSSVFSCTKSPEELAALYAAAREETYAILNVQI
jgi:hypothetical protein